MFDSDQKIIDPTYYLNGCPILESYMNFNELLGTSATESFININWENVKQAFYNFFRKLWIAIRNFVAQFFAEKELMLNEKVMDNLNTYVNKWQKIMKDELESYEAKVLFANKNEDYSTDIIQSIKSIKEECQKQVLDRNQALMGGHHSGEDYTIYKNYEVHLLENWTSSIEKSVDHSIKSSDNILHKKGIDDELIKSRANKIIVVATSTMQFVNSAISKTMISAQYVNRKNVGAEDFGKAVPVQITL